jgi:hypothetical protein
MKTFHSKFVSASGDPLVAAGSETIHSHALSGNDVRDIGNGKQVWA